MRIRFVLKNITGTDLFNRFAAAIDEEGVGTEDEGEWHATLSGAGQTWETSSSGFTYTIVNPDEGKPAVVEYDGAWRGFLDQNLIPKKELCGTTIHTEVVEGSALERHGGRFVHTDAALLAKAYGLMQRTRKDGRHVLEACFRAIEDARKIDRYMAEIGIQDSWVGVYNREDAFAAAGIEIGDPVIRVTVFRDGQHMAAEFPVEVTPLFVDIVHREGHSSELVDRVKAWIDQLL